VEHQQVKWGNLFAAIELSHTQTTNTKLQRKARALGKMKMLIFHSCVRKKKEFFEKKRKINWYKIEIEERGNRK